MNCSICLTSLKEPVSIPCGHIYCSTCIANHVNSVSDDEAPVSMATCPTCRSPFNVFTPDLSLLSKKYRPYVLPSIRRIYLDTSPYQALQKKLKDAEKRIRILENSKQDLLRECERHMAASRAHAEGEQQARRELEEMKEEALGFQQEAEDWRADATQLTNELEKVQNERDKLRKKYHRAKAQASERDKVAAEREAQLNERIEDLSMRSADRPIASTSGGTAVPQRPKRKVFGDASHNVTMASPEPEDVRYSQPYEVRPAKRAKRPLPRRRVGSAPTSTGSSNTGLIPRPSLPRSSSPYLVASDEDDPPPIFQNGRANIPAGRSYVFASDEEYLS